MEDNFNYRIFDLTTRTICTSHHVTFNESVFPCLHQNPSPWFPEDFLLPSLPSTTVQVKAMPSPRVKLVEDDDISTDEMAKSAKPKTVEMEASHRDASTVNTDESQQSMPCNHPIQDERLGPQHDDLPSVSPEPPPIRTSSRLKGVIPSYKGMSAVWEDSNLNNCFDILPPIFSGAVIDSPVPRAFKKSHGLKRQRPVDGCV